ncbi:hypothetical protein U1Q18_032577 [Sarracenia purpurea var. burkii]
MGVNMDSAHALPRAYRALMTSVDSDIIDFYPTDFEVDEEGKRFAWQAISKLPFIDEERLLFQTRKLEGKIEDDEATRNMTKVDCLFVRSSNKLGSQFFSHHKAHLGEKQTEEVIETVNTSMR